MSQQEKIGTLRAQAIEELKTPTPFVQRNLSYPWEGLHRDKRAHNAWIDIAAGEYLRVR